MIILFFYGLIIDNILGVRILAVAFISSEVVWLKGLKADALIVPLSKAPSILVITAIIISEVD